MKRILVIDDAATVRLYHTSILQAAGFAVEQAYNGVEGLEKALATPFDLYIVDVNMPKLDGYAFLEQLRALPIRQAPAVMVSTESEAADRERGLRAGANAYLVKPVHPDTLLAHARLLTGAAA